jgi:hypothetical protein
LRQSRRRVAVEELSRTQVRSSDSEWQERGQLHTREYRNKITGKKPKLLIILAPWDGTEIGNKMPLISAFFDFGLREIPQKYPL